MVQKRNVGRLSVIDRPDFRSRLSRVLVRLYAGQISRTRAAKELGIGRAKLKRLLDAAEQEIL